jgi:DNA-binding transcriptional regulator YhcF (GntR family)
MVSELDPKSAVPLYEQIAVRLKAGIATGELSAGDALPSVRSLARKLRINPGTVVQAYRALETEGFVEMRQGAGSYVKAVQAETRSRERGVQARRLIRSLLADAARLGLSRQDLKEAIRHEMEVGA